MEIRWEFANSLTLEDALCLVVAKAANHGT
jgi:hypothetical protein